MRLIDAEFEENHYASMLLNPTPDVTEQDKRNARIIIDALRMAKTVEPEPSQVARDIATIIENEQDMRILPKRGKWILDRSGAYCCSKCMEPCATYVMMKPRDKFCKMCGAKMEVTT